MNKDFVMMWVVPFLVALAVGAHVVGAVVSINPSETYNFTYSNGTNSTSWEEFFCSEENLTCADPSTVWFNTSILSGERYVQNDSNCFVDVSCQGEDDTMNLCSINRQLDPGEGVSRDSGACDIRVTCRQPEREDCDFLVENLTMMKQVEFYTEDDNIVFRFDHNTQRFNREGNFSHLFSVEYSCPQEFDISEFEGDDFLRVCQTAFPEMLSWFGDTLDRSYDSQERLENLAVQKSSVETDCVERIAEIEQKLRTCEGQINGTLVSYTRCLEDKQELDGEADIWVVASLMSGALNIALLIIMAILIFVMFKNRNQEVAQGG